MHIKNSSILNANGGTVGGIISFGQNITIYNSSYEGSMDTSRESCPDVTFLGGLISFSENTYFNITQSYSDVYIKAKDYFGGLVGFVRTLPGHTPLQNSTISNSYSLNTLEETFGADDNPGGTARAAGLVGYLINASPMVENIYTVSNIEKSTASGPIYGTCFFISEQFNFDNFALSNITNGVFANSFNCTRTGVSFESEADMKLKSTYTNWDFDNIWGIISGQTFPKYRWQFGDADGDGSLDFEDN